MSAHEELTLFVREALGRGMSRAQIETALTAAGWSTEQVRSALGMFAAVDFPIAVPNPRASLSARDAFTYLLLFATLYVVAFHLGRVLFTFINQAFPDAAVPDSQEALRSQLRFSTASLITAGPVFLYMSRVTSTAARPGSQQRLAPVRRWLTYLTLFVAACVLIGDVTTLIYSVLGGELTTRFVLKVLVVGAIAGTVFWYYVSDLKADEHEA